MTSRFEALVARFIRSGLYLRNWSPRTAHTYQQGLRRLRAFLGEGDLTKSALEDWVIHMREEGLTPRGVNMYVRSINSFLSFLHAEGLHSEHLRLKLLRCPHTIPTLLSDGDVRVLLAHKPVGFIRTRSWTLILLLLDTGVRIDEALRLERDHVQFDSLLLKVWGKGSKERMVPFSEPMRRVLFRWMQTWVEERPGQRVFATATGAPLSYRNSYRDIQNVSRRAGVTLQVHPHLFRHQFASTYIRAGGDIYRLSRILGHTSVTTTQLYLRGLGVDEFRRGHDFSPLTHAASSRT